MHKESMEGMGAHIRTLAPRPVTILDVGSMDVKGKGSYRQIIPRDYTYVGLDIKEGPNVDIVAYDFNFPLADDSFDMVISGQCFEHAENPFNLISECARVLKPGGYFIGAAPFVFPVHHVMDCWRILPDGWRMLFNSCGLELVNTYIYKCGKQAGPITGTDLRGVDQADCWGIARKRR